ncbi:MAG: bestrophin family ion channel [Planctomycetota bacterium]
MIQYPRTSWWQVVLSYRGTVLPSILGRVTAMVLLALAVEYLYSFSVSAGWIVKQGPGLVDPAGYAVVGSLLGFLIVFRMNSSANRYWEGRSHWGMLINSTRSLARCAAVYAPPAQDLALLIGGYVLSLKQTLRDSRDLDELQSYLSGELYSKALRFGNPPSAIAAAMSQWIAERYQAGKIDSVQVRHMEDLLARIVDSQGGCEKIKKTPLPFVYAAMIKQLILVYLITLPIVLCGRTGWWTPLIVAIVSFGFFGIEEAGVEIEDPFGLDDNCLPLEAICVGIIRDTAQVTQAFSGSGAASDGQPAPFVGSMNSIAQVTTPQLKR